MLWTAQIKMNGKLFIKEFESLSAFRRDALLEARSRFGTDEIVLYPA
jgi:hypothetical protein|tara:strand:+ start:404 stop:544 length:141 start_codon:yes stop_codon:yes gene_type:complete